MMIEGAQHDRFRSAFTWIGLLVLWSALVVFCVVLLGYAVTMTAYFEPTGEAITRARIGNRLILAGSLGLLLAAVWARLMRTPLWACILVAAPAALVGGLTLLAGGSLFPQLSYLLAVPTAAAGIIAVLILARPMVSGSPNR
jgi:hypothetical protein